MNGYADLGDLSENKRIKVIGRFVMSQSANSAKPKIVGIALEDEDKAKRYEKKLLKMFPTIQIIDIVPGLVPGTVLLRISSPAL